MAFGGKKAPLFTKKSKKKSVPPEFEAANKEVAAEEGGKKSIPEWIKKKIGKA